MNTAGRLTHSFEERSLPWLLVVAGTVLGALLFAWRNPTWINADCSVNLYLGMLLLEGQVPYVDFIEINPPLILYVNALPALLARAFDIEPILCFQWCVIAVWIISIRQLRAILFFAPRPFRPKEIGLILVAWSFSTAFVHLQDHFGQREHLFLLLYVPFLALRTLRHEGAAARGRRLAIFTGLLAGVGVSLKPHYLGAAILLEVLLLSCSRNLKRAWDVENLALGTVVLAYIAHWLVVPDEMREAFFGRWVPLVVGGYSAYDAKGLLGRWLPMVNLTWPLDTRWTRWPRVLVSGTVLVAELACLGWTLRMAAKSDSRFRFFLISFPGLALLGLVLFWVQGKGFPYHRIPLDLPCFLTLCFLFLEYTHRGADHGIERSGAQHRGFIPWVVTLAALLFILRVGFSPAGETSRVVAEMDGGFRRLLETESRPKDAVLAFSTSVAPIFPAVVQLDRRPGSRYIWSFPLAFLYHQKRETPERVGYHKGDTMPEEERRFLEELREDVDRRKPTLVMIPNRRGGQGLPEWFSVAEYLESTGWIQSALAEYERIEANGAWNGYRLKPTPEGPS